MAVSTGHFLQFLNRRDAGRKLAGCLPGYAEQADVLVLALPRGGVPVAWEVAQSLHLEMDLLLVRKLGAPRHEEYAIGAIASGGVRVLNEQALAEIPEAAHVLDAITARELQELERREAIYRQGRPPLAIRGKRVILVDDGLATGSTMCAAVRCARQHHPAKIVVAVPVGAESSCNLLRQEADEVICVLETNSLMSVGQFYNDFTQTTDAEVRALLGLRDPRK